MQRYNENGNQLNNIMFHCTLRKKLKTILENGLQPCKPPLIRNALKGVYLSSKPFDWMHTATEETTKAGAMVTVNIEGLTLIQDENLKASDSCFVCRDCIPPDRFVDVVVSTDEKPYQFEQIDFMEEKKNG